MTRRPAGDDDVRSVFLIDGWSAFRRSLRLFVESAGHRVVGDADSLDRAAATAGLPAVDVVIFDPGPDWVEVDADLAKLRKGAPGACVVLLTAEPLPQHTVAKAVRAGISSYLTKRADPADVLRAIDIGRPGGLVLVPRDVLTGEPRERSFSYPTGVALPDLTRREQEILSLIASGYSNRSVAEMLWVAEQTVKFHLVNVYRKLGVRNRADAVQAARRLGLA